MNGNTSHRLGKTSLVAFAGIAMLALPPAFAQQRGYVKASEQPARHDQDGKDAVLRALKRAIHLLQREDHAKDAMALKKLLHKIAEGHADEGRTDSHARVEYLRARELAVAKEHEALRKKMAGLERAIEYSKKHGWRERADALEKQRAELNEYARRSGTHAKNPRVREKMKAEVRELELALRELKAAHNRASKRGEYESAKRYAEKADVMLNRLAELRLRAKAESANGQHAAGRPPRSDRASESARVRKLEEQVHNLTRAVEKLLHERHEKKREAPEELEDVTEAEEAEEIEEVEEVEEVEVEEKAVREKGADPRRRRGRRAVKRKGR